MKIFKIIWVVLLSIIVLLIVTNPSPNKFEESLPVLTGISNKRFDIKSDMSNILIQGREANYILFSIYRVKIETNVIAYRRDRRYVGILENFIRIN